MVVNFKMSYIDKELFTSLNGVRMNIILTGCTIELDTQKVSDVCIKLIFENVTNLTNYLKITTSLASGCRDRLISIMQTGRGSHIFYLLIYSDTFDLRTLSDKLINTRILQRFMSKCILI